MNTDESTAESECSVDSDGELWDFTCKEIVDSDETGCSTTNSSVEDLRTATNRLTISPTPSQLQHSLSFNSRDSLFEDSCDEEFPDEFFLFPSDYGNIAMILGPDDWEKLETENSSEKNVILDDGGTTSTGRDLGQSYDGACDIDSKASSHSCCHSPVPKEMASYLSCGSDKDPVTVVATMSDYSHDSTNNSLDDCDSISESYEDSSDANRGLYKLNPVIPQLDNFRTVEQQTTYKHHTI